MRRTTLLIMAIMAITTTFAQADADYVMFENTRLVVKTDMYKEFGKAMAHHNSTYHADGPYHANVWNVAVGANAGEIVWSMGPCTFAQHDARPGGDEHMEDWLYNVMPTIESIEGSNMWRLDKDHSYIPEGEGVSPKLSIRVYDLEDWQHYRFKDLMEKVVQVYKEKNYEWSLGTYWSEFDVEADEDVAIVWGFNKWAWFDKDSKFRADFEEIHGEGSWFKFLEELRGTVKSAKDEVWEIMPKLSGDGK